jgi:hypothetical protein
MLNLKKKICHTFEALMLGNRKYTWPLNQSLIPILLKKPKKHATNEHIQVVL